STACSLLYEISLVSTVPQFAGRTATLSCLRVDRLRLLVLRVATEDSSSVGLNRLLGGTCAFSDDVVFFRKKSYIAPNKLLFCSI
ncbi:hypothetical protein, partial [uncultured Alistipes sp.]|uniref:hypothetical protein n=1 Tax=uncultured Alistipes sp. TaxID=538949 RepID=UPI0025949E48